MTDSEWLRGLATHCGVIEAHRVRAIADRLEAMEAGFRRLQESSDLEMLDGDLARNIADELLGAK